MVKISDRKVKELCVNCGYSATCKLFEHELGLECPVELEAVAKRRGNNER